MQLERLEMRDQTTVHGLRAAFSTLPDALDDVMTMASSSSPLTAATTTGAPAPFVVATPGTASSPSSPAPAVNAGAAATASATARRGSLMYCLATRGLPSAFVSGQDHLLAPESCAMLDAVREELTRLVTDRCSQFLVSDAKCRADATAWARRRTHPYQASAVLGRVLRLHSLLLTDACYTYDLMTLPGGGGAGGGGGGAKTDNNNNTTTTPATARGAAAATGTVKQRLEHTCERHVREAVCQALFSVCAVFWEASVVRWALRYAADNPEHFEDAEDDEGDDEEAKREHADGWDHRAFAGATSNEAAAAAAAAGAPGASAAASYVASPYLDVLDGDRLDTRFAIEDGAFDELLATVRDAIACAIADTI